jgi:membrane associated rhomboid family serine protease
MLIPLGTSVQSVRRVPYVTFALMLINTLLCVYTSWMRDPGDAQFRVAKSQIVVLSAYFPDVPTSGDASAIVAEAKKKYPQIYVQGAKQEKSELEELPPVVAQVKMGQLSAEQAMDAATAHLNFAEQESFSWKYAFHSYRSSPASLVTSSFLHQGVLHLFGNMWFLYLTGAILEASWGYWLFTLVYLVGGVAALFAQAVADPASFTFVVGASGAVAACMGAFLVRFPWVKINLAWVLWVWIRPITYRFAISALYILPIWVGLEVIYGFLNDGYVAHWAHVGGFAFGAVAALLIEKTGLEKFVNREDEKQTWHPDPQVLEAIAMMEKGSNEQAALVMRRYVQVHPTSLDGYETLLRAQQASEDKEGQKQTLGILCRLAMKGASVNEAWKRYEEWLHVGGGPLTPDMWIEFCHYLEREKAYPRAVEECERLASAHPQDRRAFDAMLLAARINFEKLNNVVEAQRWYLAARESDAKDLAMDAVIEDGLRRCGRRTATGGR